MDDLTMVIVDFTGEVHFFITPQAGFHWLGYGPVDDDLERLNQGQKLTFFAEDVLTNDGRVDTDVSIQKVMPEVVNYLADELKENPEKFDLE